MTRLDKEFERLEQGSQSHADFRVAWETLLLNMDDCGMEVKPPQYLYRKYLAKMNDRLRDHVCENEHDVLLVAVE